MSTSMIHLGSRRLVVADEKMSDVLALARRAAKTLAPVMLYGESGSGKELIARYIHSQSCRASGPLVSVNCAAVPEGLIESELFGHERGAFTGAVALHVGKFERASGGTLLLDEVSEMPVHLQAKLLRVLQEGEMDRLGGRDSILVNCRIISTTNREPKHSIASGDFREDLFYRLNVIRIDCPALRGRPQAIEALAQEFVAQACQRQQKPLVGFSSYCKDQLLNYSWPGNIRELQNVIERAVLLCDEKTIEQVQLEGESWHGASLVAIDSKSPVQTLSDIEKQHILSTLDKTRGNRSVAAQQLGISVRTLRNKLKEYRFG